VRYDDWFDFNPGVDTEKKHEFLLRLLSDPAQPLLQDRPEIAANQVLANVAKKKVYMDDVKAYKESKKRRIHVEF